MGENLKIKGLKKAAGQLKRALPDAGWCAQISYDIRDGEIMLDYHRGGNEWTEYRAPEVLFVCNTERPLKMAELQVRIERALEEREFRKSEYVAWLREVQGAEE